MFHETCSTRMRVNQKAVHANMGGAGTKTSCARFTLDRSHKPSTEVNCSLLVRLEHFATVHGLYFDQIASLEMSGTAFPPSSLGATQERLY